MFLTSITIAAIFLTIVFGFQYRMVKQPIARKAGKSLMNIFMGITLLLIATNQILFPHLSALRLIICSILALLGLFNLVMGIKNYRFYKSSM